MGVYTQCMGKLNEATFALESVNKALDRELCDWLDALLHPHQGKLQQTKSINASITICSVCVMWKSFMSDFEPSGFHCPFCLCRTDLRVVLALCFDFLLLSLHRKSLRCQGGI
jgi:hypothetical protein